MTSSSALSVEEYLSRSDKPACEYIDGILRPKARPTKLHAPVQFMLVLLLRQQNVEALPEVTVRLSKDKFLVPDVVAAPQIQDPYPTEPVLLCAEILSPEDRLSAAFAKCEDYHAWGVPYCWIIDPLKRTAWEYNAGSEPVHIGGSGVLSAGTLTIRLLDLFPG
jgi:Uma2 family endonuclease